MTAKKIISPSVPISGPVSGKETVYVDVDDEITHVIDKVKTSDKKIIALVLPKRAPVLQSVVNMKLLKKAAQNSRKNVVLITSEAGLLPLAGAAGLHVAKSLQSKPLIPPPPQHLHDDTATVDTDPDEGANLDRTAAIGTLAAAAANQDDDTDTIQLDNVSVDEPAKAGTSKKLKHLKVPNFERFRLGFFLAGLGVLLLFLAWYLAIIVLPKAKVTIKTDTTSVVSSFDFTAGTAITELDVTAQKIPAVSKELKKTDTEKVPATGEKDLGTKATGSVTLSIPCASVSGSPPTVPAGTTLSTGGLNYITDETVTLNEAAFSPCRFTKTADVTAAQNGDQYNIGSGKTFTVSGFSAVSGNNAAGFAGGTSKKVKVVAQKDVDEAVTKIKARTDAQASDELRTQFESENLLPLKDTLKSAEPKVTPTPAVDAEASEVTVALETTYTMLGVKREDLVEVIKRDIENEVDLERQSITDDGIDVAVMRINNQASATEAYLNFRTSVTAGPELDEAAIKEAIRGKKRGEAEDYISNLPGVEEVVVDYSPFWVYSTPKAAKKITIHVEKTGDQPAVQANQ